MRLLPGRWFPGIIRTTIFLQNYFLSCRPSAAPLHCTAPTLPLPNEFNHFLCIGRKTGPSHSPAHLSTQWSKTRRRHDNRTRTHWATTMETWCARDAEVQRVTTGWSLVAASHRNVLCIIMIAVVVVRLGYCDWIRGTDHRVVAITATKGSHRKS